MAVRLGPQWPGDPASLASLPTAERSQSEASAQRCLHQGQVGHGKVLLLQEKLLVQKLLPS